MGLRMGGVWRWILVCGEMFGLGLGLGLVWVVSLVEVATVA